MNNNPGLIGKKLGNTQIFTDEGEVRRVTAIEAGPCVVLAKRTEEKHGYTALQIGFGTKKAKQLTKPLAGQFKALNTEPKEVIQEFRVTQKTLDAFEVGQTLGVADLFEAGGFVDVTGKSKGAGFSGVIKRHNFAGAGTVGHGTHEAKRHGGSIGMNMTPGRTFKGMKMPGQHGKKRTTVMNLEVVKVLNDEGIILVDGSVPGAAGGTVTVKGAIKKSQKAATLA